MLNTAQMRISGVSSARDVRAVSDTLTGIQGVADVGINAEQGLLEVKFDPGKTDERSLRQAVQQAGFSVQ